MYITFPSLSSKQSVTFFTCLSCRKCPSEGFLRSGSSRSKEFLSCVMDPVPSSPSEKLNGCWEFAFYIFFCYLHHLSFLWVPFLRFVLLWLLFLVVSHSVMHVGGFSLLSLGFGSYLRLTIQPGTEVFSHHQASNESSKPDSQNLDRF